MMNFAPTFLLLTVIAASCSAQDGPAPTPAPAAATNLAPLPSPTRSAPQTTATPAPDPETVEVLLAGLDSRDYATRLVATEALGCAPPTVALAPLERQLGDPEEDVRAAAILALHQQAEPTARALLVSVRDDEQEQLSLRVLAAAALLHPPPSCD